MDEHLEAMWIKNFPQINELDIRERYRIFPNERRIHLGRELIPGQPILCRLCGDGDSWIGEDRNSEDIPKVFVCDHGTVEGFCRRIDSIPMKYIHHYSLTGFGKNEIGEIES